MIIRKFDTNPYEILPKKVKVHKYNKKAKTPKHPYGYKATSLKEIEQNIQRIIARYKTRRNDQRTWSKLKKEVEEYMFYVWKKDRSSWKKVESEYHVSVSEIKGYKKTDEFYKVECDIAKTMTGEEVLDNNLKLMILIINNENIKDNLMTVVFSQIQNSK